MSWTLALSPYLYYAISALLFYLTYIASVWNCVIYLIAKVRYTKF